MPRNVKDIIAKLPDSRTKAIMDAADAMYVEEMTLAELRQARFSSQAKLAEKLGIKQAALSRLERRSDMHISKLRKLIAGMGGTMKIVARFPGRGPDRLFPLRHGRAAMADELHCGSPVQLHTPPNRPPLRVLRVLLFKSPCASGMTNPRP